MKISDDQYKELVSSVVGVFKRDIYPALLERVKEDAYNDLLKVLKNDVTKIILAARNVKMDDFTSTISPKTSVFKVPEWSGNSRIYSFCKKHEMKRLEDVYIKGISRELADRDLHGSDILDFVNALKIRGYELRKERTGIGNAIK